MTKKNRIRENFVMNNIKYFRNVITKFLIYIVYKKDNFLLDQQ
jgi:hypothetical protein